MSQAKPMTEAEIKGYRTLSDAEIALMNDLKDISRAFISKLNEVHATLPSSARTTETSDQYRWLAIAKTDMQTACMAATRAVGKSDGDC